MSLWWIVTLVLVVSGLVFVGVAVAWSSRWGAQYRIRPALSRKVTGLRLWGRVLGNMALSGAAVFLMTYVAQGWLVDPSASFGVAAAAQIVGILLVYDLLYYFLHRYPFHQWTRLKRVHTVHHVIRAPTAVESLYLHPVELLLTLVVCAFGPVSVGTYGIILGVHGTLNIIVHAGLDLPFFPFRALSFLSRKHATHHISMRGGNYASLTPLWDVLLGTAE